MHIFGMIDGLAMRSHCPVWRDTNTEHAKWGVIVDDTTGATTHFCVGDLNRYVQQFKRGGAVVRLSARRANMDDSVAPGSLWRLRCRSASKIAQ